MKTKFLLFVLIISSCISSLFAQYALIVPQGRNCTETRPLAFPEFKKEVYDRDIVVKCTEQYSLVREDEVDVNFTWYQNDKDALVILALGKGGLLKDKLPFVRELTKHADVIIFDYEWQNPAPLLTRMARIPTPIKRYFTDNYKEIQTIVTWIRTVQRKKQYKSIVGHGECYSTYTLAQAEALKAPGSIVFDKLVLDSPIISARSSVKEILKNPGLCCDPLTGKFPALLKSFFALFAPCTNRIVDFCSNEYSVLEYVEKVTIPVLFIRGQHDPMVTSTDFFKMFGHLASEQKAVFMTPFHHSNSFQWENARPQYCYIEQAFIHRGFEDFVAFVTQKHEEVIPSKLLGG